MPTAARTWARTAILGMVRETGGQTVARPVLRSSPDLGMTITDAEPDASWEDEAEPQ